MDGPSSLVSSAPYSVSGEDSEVKPQDNTWTLERPLGNNETAYFLPSRASGVNDMWAFPNHFFNRDLHSRPFRRYLHLGFLAPEHLVRRARVRMVWAILRVRHPLLASKVVMHDYNDIKFV